MHNSRLVPFVVLVFGLLTVVDAHAQNGPQLPSASACTQKTLSFSSSGNTVSTLSKSCFNRVDVDLVKTWAQSEYTAYPFGWDSLTHLANVKTFDGLTLLGEDTQTKYQTTGIACPIVWAGTSAYVSVHGYHEYDVDLLGNIQGVPTQIDE